MKKNNKGIWAKWNAQKQKTQDASKEGVFLEFIQWSWRNDDTNMLLWLDSLCYAQGE